MGPRCCCSQEAPASVSKAAKSRAPVYSTKRRDAVMAVGGKVCLRHKSFHSLRLREKLFTLTSSPAAIGIRPRALRVAFFSNPEGDCSPLLADRLARRFPVTKSLSLRQQGT